MNFFEKLNSKFLIAPKLTYLSVYLQFYAFYAMRFAFAKYKFGVSEEDYGKFTGYTQFITFFTSIMLGNYIDRTRKYKFTLISLILLSTAVFMCFYVESITSINPMMFWVLFQMYLILNNPKQPLLDKIVIEYLDSFSAIGSKIYGKQRLWGTLSISISTYLCEWCSTVSKKKNSYNFNNLIYFNIVATALAALCVIFLVNSKSNTVEDQLNEQITEKAENIEKTDQEAADKSADNKQSVQETSNSITSTGLRKYLAFLELFKSTDYLFFFFVIFSNAITRSAVSIYLSLFHKEILMIAPYELPKNMPSILSTVLGVINNNPISTLATAGIVFEVLSLFFADKILVRLGYFFPLVISQIIATARFLAYYFISADNKHCYGLSCLFELLRGIYFGLIHISSVYIATKMAPSNLRATSQMVYQSTFSALGYLVSGYCFGNLFKGKLEAVNTYEGREAIYRQMFLINAAISLVTLAGCIVKYGFIDKVLFNKEAEKEKLNKFENNQVLVQ